MFQIGQFSKIACVSTRQLRHYDDIGLFKPEVVDEASGYRYYSATQLPQLNRIIALKDLGLSLEEITQFMNDNISAQQIHALLRAKKAQVEQTLRDELNRLHSIEERIWQIETDGVLSDENVVLKDIPPLPFLSIREQVPSVKEGFEIMYDIHRRFPQGIENGTLGNFGLVFHSEGFSMENVDVEMGFMGASTLIQRFPLSDGRELRMRTLPAHGTMATLARVGIYNNSVGHYGALGTWIEKHGYRMCGPGSEVFLQPFTPGKEDEAVIEIRLPVEKAAV